MHIALNDVIMQKNDGQALTDNDDVIFLLAFWNETNAFRQLKIYSSLRFSGILADRHKSNSTICLVDCYVNAKINPEGISMAENG